jgi:hypothetical protein
MRRVRSSTFVVLAGLFGVAVACSTSTAPLGQGDDFVSDVDGGDATQQPMQGDDGPYDDGFFQAAESGYPAAPDGYAPYNWCTMCGCPEGTFCFGGGTGFTDFDGDCHADAGAPLGASTLAIGCYPLPACGDGPACDCIIAEISKYVTGCYPDCTDTTNIVYCPHP